MNELFLVATTVVFSGTSASELTFLEVEELIQPLECPIRHFAGITYHSGARYTLPSRCFAFRALESADPSIRIFGNKYRNTRNIQICHTLYLSSG